MLVKLPLTQWLAFHFAGFTVRQLYAWDARLQGNFPWLFDRKRTLAEIHACGVRAKTAQLWCEYIRGSGNIPERITAALKWQDSHISHHLCHYADEHYPPLLRESNSPPLLLYVRGDISCLSSRAIGIVGARNATPQGLENAKWFSYQLAEKGIYTISGLALGIDAACHIATLAAKEKQPAGSTLAIMGTGVDVVYPTRHANLAERICQHGALISEFPLGTPPIAKHFPRRNRIISGMALGVLVVEASLHSGSLITARYALDGNREVFAIPGHIANPMVKGCHKLIKEGAMLVDHPQDLLDSLAISPVNQQYSSNDDVLATEHLPQFSPDVRAILDAMGFAETNVDTLCETLNMSVSRVNSTLIELEIEGLVQSTASGYVRLVKAK